MIFANEITSFFTTNKEGLLIVGLFCLAFGIYYLAKAYKIKKS